MSYLKEAITFAARLEKFWPFNAQLKTRLAMAYYRTDRFVEAARRFKEAVGPIAIGPFQQLNALGNWLAVFGAEQPKEIHHGTGKSCGNQAWGIHYQQRADSHAGSNFYFSLVRRIGPQRHYRHTSLMHFLSTIDYRKGALILRRATPENLKQFEAQAEAYRAKRIPFWLIDTHYIVAWGAANRIGPLLFWVDTGLAGKGFIPSKSVSAGLHHTNSSATIH